MRNERLAAPTPNYSGPQRLVGLLAERGIESQLLPFAERSGNSLNEAQTVVRKCRALRARSLVIASPPFHLPRALLTALSVARREYPSLRVYAVAGGRPLGWWAEEAAHSQGVLVGRRVDLFAAEVERIGRYAAKGDLLSPAEGLAELRRRDTAAGEDERRSPEPGWTRSPSSRSPRAGPEPAPFQL